MIKRTWIALFAAMWLGAAAFGQGVPEPIVPDGLGANIHFVEPNEKEVDRLAEVGYRFIRMDFSWGATERSAGEYNFTGYDRLVESLAKRNIRPIFILDYSNRLYDDGLSPHTDAGRKAFAKWAAAAAVHFKDKKIIWEIWNEPNISQFWKPKPSAQDYASLALETIDTVKKAQPNAFVIGPASSTFPWDFFQVLADRGVLAKLDAVSVHPYRQLPPETVAKDYQRLRLLIDRHSDHPIPIISGEWGYSTGWKNMSEEKQAQYLPRQWLTNLANDVNLSIWYDWKDDGADPKEPEHHFGSVHQDLSDKPASLAAKKLIDTLKGLRFIRRLAIGAENDYLLLFSDQKRAIVAAWTTGQPHKVKLRDEVELDGTPKYIEIPNAAQLGAWRPASQLQVVDAAHVQLKLSLDGRLLGRRRLHLRTPRSIVEMELSPMMRRVTVQIDSGLGGIEALDVPISLSDDPLDSARVMLLVKNAIQARLLPVVDGQDMLELDNPSGRPFNGTIEIFNHDLELSAPFAIAANQVHLMLPLPLPAGAGTATVELRGDNGAVVGRAEPAKWHALTDQGNWTSRLDGDPKAEGQVQIATSKLPTSPRPGIDKGIEISYHFGPGWRFALLDPPNRSIPGKPAELGFWLYGDNSANILRSRFKDSSGQTFQTHFGPITWTGWKWITIPLTGPDLAHWGPGDGTIHYPISWEGAILIDNSKLNADKPFKVYIAGPAARE